MTTYTITRDSWDSDTKEYVPTKTKVYYDPITWAADVTKYANVKGHDNWALQRDLVANENGGFDYYVRGVKKN